MSYLKLVDVICILFEFHYNIFSSILVKKLKKFTLKPLKFILNLEIYRIRSMYTGVYSLQIGCTYDN